MRALLLLLVIGCGRGAVDMALPKSPLSFKFGAVSQDEGDKHLTAGTLLEARNVRLTKANELRKRHGFDRASPTADSGSFTAPAESVVSDGVTLITRDAADIAWAEDLTANTRTNRGGVKRAYPDDFPMTTVPGARKPTIVAVGTTYWVFTQGEATAGGFTSKDGYWFAIIDQATRKVLRAPSRIAATLVESWTVVVNAAATQVWVLFGNSGGVVTAHKFTVSSPGTAPTATSYLTGVTDVKGVDAHRLASGDIAVAITYDNATPRSRLHCSVLDTATGLPKGSPAAVTTSFGTASVCSPPSILVSDGSNGSWYVAFWCFDSGNNILKLVTVTAATLAAAVVDLQSLADDGSTGAGSAVGYLAANGDRVVYGALYVGKTLRRYTRTGSTTVATIRLRSYPVSKPVSYSSAWYLVTGFRVTNDPIDDLQMSYFLTDSDGQILVPMLVGLGSGYALSSFEGTAVYQAFGTVPQQTQTGRIDVVLLRNMGGEARSSDDFAPTLMSINMAATYMRPCRWRDRALVVPGGQATIVGISDNVFEIAPMLYPPPMTLTVGGGAAASGDTVVQARYRIVSANGTFHRSRLAPAQEATFTDMGASVAVPTLTHLMPGVTAQIEVYLSDPGETTLYLAGVIANDTSASTVSLSFNPNTFAHGEELDQAPLSPAPPAPSRFAACWQNRVLLGGRKLWVSAELEEGFGPRFNERMTSEWLTGEGDMLGGAEVNSQSFAIFKSNAVGLITGAGPDGLGHGNYVIDTVAGDVGCTNVASIVSGPGIGGAGAVYWQATDGRIRMLAAGAGVLDISGGVEDYASETVTSAVHVEEERQIWFGTSGPRVLVLDYAHPTPEQPWGRWFTWASSGLLQSYGGAITPAKSAYLIESAGTLRKLGTGWTDATSGAAASVLMKVRTGDLAAAGGLQYEYRLDLVGFLGKFISAHTLQFTIVSDYGGTGLTYVTPARAVTAAPEQFATPAPGHDRVQSTAVTIEETVGTGESFVFDGLYLLVQPRGAVKLLPASQRM